MNVAYSMKVFMNYYDGFMKLKSCYHVNESTIPVKMDFHSFVSMLFSGNSHQKY